MGAPANMSDFHLLVNSKDSDEYFGDNGVGYFRVKLKHPIILEGNKWHIGLCEINGTLWDVGADDTVFIFCNLTTGLKLPSNTEGLLRAMNVARPTNTYMRYDQVVYTPIQTHYIDVIEISLKVNGFLKEVGEKKQASRSSNNAKANTWCLLHFKWAA